MQVQNRAKLSDDGRILYVRFNSNDKDLLNKISKVPAHKWNPRQNYFMIKTSLDAIRFVVNNGFQFEDADIIRLHKISDVLIELEHNKESRLTLSQAISAEPIPHIANKMKLPAWDYQWVPTQYALLSNGCFFIGDDMAAGKALPVSELVLTPKGWTPIGDIKVGDSIFGKSGKPIKVLKVHPQTGRKVYKVTLGDGCSVRCSPDHLWEIRDNNDYRRGTKKLLTTKQILEAGITDKAGNRQWRIPVCDSIRFTTKKLPLDPYTLGVYLGDGDSWSGSARITSDETLIAVVGGSSPRPRNDSGCATFTVKGIMPYLKKLKLNKTRSEDKFIPDQYMRGSIDQRRALLAGLVDTDGSCGGTYAEFCSTSKQLAEQTAELVRSLGGIAYKMGTRIPKYTHKGELREGRLSYRFNFRTPFNPFRLSRKADLWQTPKNKNRTATHFIDSIEPDQDEETVCITVDAPDGLFITRDYIVTHNCVESLMVVNHERWQHKPVLIVSPQAATFKKELHKFFGEQGYLINSPLHGPLPRIRYYLTTHHRLKHLFDNPDKPRKRKPREFLKDFFIIVDESHLYKNPAAVRTKLMTKICDLAENKILMTGTAIMNRADEMYQQLRMLNKDFMSWHQYMRLFCGLEHTAYGTRHDGAVNLQSLRGYLFENVFVRREKEMIQDQLPEKMRDAVELKDNPVDVEADSMFEMFAESARIKAEDPDFLEWLENAIEVSPKIGIFCYHKVMINAVKKVFQKLGKRYVVIDGTTKPDERQDLATQFAEDPDIAGAILSHTVASTGLNDLQAASVCVMAEQFWTPGTILQSENRFHRPGLKNALLIFYPMVTRFEYRLTELLLEKIGIIRRIIGRDPIPDNFNDDSLLKQISAEFNLPISSNRS